FTMSKEPVEDWFFAPKVPSIRGSFPPVPTISGDRVFEDSTEVTISAPEEGFNIVYSVTSGEDKPGEPTKLYKGPFTVSETSIVRAITVGVNGSQSLTAESKLHKMPHDWDVRISSKYSNQYTGGGPKGLIDGLRGTTNFASGEWQGYQGQDFEAVIDLKRPIKISKVGGGFLQVARSWIWMPRSAAFEVSDDGKNWRKVADIETDFPEREMEHTIRDYVKTIDPVTARYVRVKAVNFGKIPAWHPGAGFDAYIFVDEIIIE
ncbi:MAG: discoidin domain-containing protein, partial [Aridibacter famidurans]|nr:discoidin domain-containing protein [Aridibacter famidurans]